MANLRDGAIFGDYALLGGDDLVEDEPEIWDKFCRGVNNLDGYTREFINRIYKIKNIKLLKYIAVKVEELAQKRTEVFQGIKPLEKGVSNAPTADFLPKTASKKSKFLEENRNRKPKLDPQNKIKRSASIQIAEDILMLEISHHFHHYYVLPVIANTVMSKIKLIKRLEFLPTLTSVERLVVGNEMTSQSFSMGQCLLKEGSIPQIFYIIEEGIAEVVWMNK